MTVDEIIATQKENIIREIPHFEGYYSMRSDGRIISHSRKIVRSDGKPMTIKGRILKEIFPLNPNEHMQDPTYTLAKEDLSLRVRRNAIYRMTFPEFFSPIENIEGEVWKEIVNCPGFAASNKGRIKRVTQQFLLGELFPYTLMEELMTQYNRPMGVGLIVKLFYVEKGYLTRSVARLVYETFNPNIELNKHILYRDGDYSNVCLENLYVA